jgi:undecaprenyl-diphosphatase
VNIVDAALLGLVQGLTEFLPISSSGHLALFEHFLRINSGDLSFEITVHVGTLLAVLVYFRARLWALARSVFGISTGAHSVSEGRTLVLLIVIGTIPAVIVGFLFKSSVERLFASPGIAAGLLMVTGVYLLTLRFAPAKKSHLSTPRAWWIGVAQAAAILPGISRSGTTITTGVLLGVNPGVAAEFSFLLSIPAILGASVLSLPDAIQSGQFGMAHCIGGLVAAVVGYLALAAVFASLRRGRFSWFGAYCLIAGGVAGVWLWLHP